MMDSSGNKKDNQSMHGFLSASLIASNPLSLGGQHTIDDETKETKAIDNLKVLIQDHSSNASVLPPWFTFKACMLFFSVCVILLTTATVEVYLFTDFLGEALLCFRTLQYLAKRSIGCSIVLQGILSDFTIYSQDFAAQQLQEAKELNSKLLFATSSDVSKNLLSSDDYYSLVHSSKCDDDQDMNCWRFSLLFDYFTVRATNIINKTTLNQEEVDELTSIYNDHLFKTMHELHNLAFNYITDQFSYERIIILVIFFVVIGITCLLFLFLFIPFMKGLDSTLESVKSPLKYIPPLHVPDLPKVMQYLQGEADWVKSKTSDDQGDAAFGNFLNIIDIPHAVFETDQTLLFANNAFYTIIGAPREACVGLPMESIFSRVMMFKNCESHPFNQIVDVVNQKAQLAENESIQITTSFEKPGRKTKNVEMSFYKILNEEKVPFYVLFLKDLTGHDHIEALTEQEAILANSLKDFSTPVPLIRLMKDSEDVVQPKKFTDLPLVRFTISYASPKDEYDGVLVEGCQLFVKSSLEVASVFPMVVKVIHEPPSWTYITLPDENETLESLTIQTAHFILACIDSFVNATSTFKISVVLHVGDILVVPMKIKLSVMECFESGFQRLVAESKATQGSGKFYMTKEAAHYLADQKTIVVTEDPEKNLFVASSNHNEE